MAKSYILNIQCDDRPGIVAAVTTQLFESGGNIIEAQQFVDPNAGRFYIRIEFSLEESTFKRASLHDGLRQSGILVNAEWRLRPVDEKKRVLFLVSKYDHCLADLLYRERIGELNMHVVGIVSNHPQDILTMTTVGNIPYHHFPVTKETKHSQEAQIKELIEATGTELVVLARYMQILSDDFANYLSGRCINIHHSFLPGFKGARPYHQAYQRGVKVIGATAHYVTGDLDEGPIIVQDVEHISHRDTPDDLVRKGRDIERRVLARAVRYHLQDRLLINGTKTVVFYD